MNAEKITDPVSLPRADVKTICQTIFNAASVFAFLADVTDISSDRSLVLSDAGRDGLSYICGKMAEEAWDSYGLLSASGNNGGSHE